MSLLGSTFLIYAVIGLGVAVAVYLSDMARSPAQRCFQTAACVIFWPLFVPLLLQRKPARAVPLVDGPPGDEMMRAIRQVEMELHAALEAANALDHVGGPLEELHSRWTKQAARIREMDRLLASPEYTVPNDAIQAEKPILRDGGSQPERIGGVNAMSTIVERLHQVRRQAHDDLMESLATMRQSAALLHLARFTAAPASRVIEILEEIKSAGERLDALTDFHAPIPCGADGSASRG